MSDRPDVLTERESQSIERAIVLGYARMLGISVKQARFEIANIRAGAPENRGSRNY
jgi:hypothetical protein